MTALANRLGRGLRAVGRQALLLVLVVVWLGAVVYPDPRPFVESLSRLREPPVDRGAVASIADDLPADYQALEEFSLHFVAYASAWTTYGLPWYFPTVSEVVRYRAGDCQARAVFFASLLEAKEMPYTLRYSFDHVWIDYPGKPVTALEDPATSFVANSGDGWLSSLPKRFPVWSILKERVEYHWVPMPGARKALFLFGALVILGWGERRLWGRIACRLGWAALEPRWVRGVARRGPDSRRRLERDER